MIDRRFSSACFLRSGVCVLGGHSGTLYFTDRNLSCVVAIMRPCDKAPITCLHEYRHQGQTRVIAADAQGCIAGIQMTVDDVKSLHVEAEELFTLETKHQTIRSMDVKKNILAFGCPSGAGTMDLDSLQIKVQQSVHHGETLAVHAHAHYPLFASVGSDRVLKVMQSQTRSEIFHKHFPKSKQAHADTLDIHGRQADTGFSSVGWSSCGTRLAMGTLDGEVRNHLSKYP